MNKKVAFLDELFNSNVQRLGLSFFLTQLCVTQSQLLYPKYCTLPVGGGMANIAALWASMGSNIVAAGSSMELFINPDSGAMHLKQRVRF